MVPGDDPLPMALKSLRTSLAKEEGVPAYVIFSDRSLVDMAVQVSDDPVRLRRDSRSRQAKLQRYGEAFLDVVRSHADAA